MDGRTDGRTDGRMDGSIRGAGRHVLTDLDVGDFERELEGGVGAGDPLEDGGDGPGDDAPGVHVHGVALHGVRLARRRLPVCVRVCLWEGGREDELARTQLQLTCGISPLIILNQSITPAPRVCV